MSPTPGPWKAHQIGHIYTEGDPYGHGQMLVCQVRGWGHLTGKGGGCAFDEDKAVAIQDANARLIAAAPELLEALKRAMNAIHSEYCTATCHPECVAATEAINRATEGR